MLFRQFSNENWVICQFQMCRVAAMNTYPLCNFLAFGIVVHCHIHWKELAINTVNQLCFFGYSACKIWINHNSECFWGLTFSLWFGVSCSLPSGLFFLRCQQKVDGNDRQSEDVVRIASNTLSPKGKEDFTQSVLNTEDIRKQRFTFASRKRMAQTA